ncbi:proline iminopeptidase [Hysterangium stoloniferum]|nr:proline iminopeptidase [Hysterangium stoloniferum]
MSPLIAEGTVDFDVPAAGKPCKTWYKIFGDVKNSKHRPVIAIHGGPGVPHNYILSIADLATKHDIPVIFYDQIGTGNSTHLQEKKGDREFWIESLFLDELENLITKLDLISYDILGNSWGGMLAGRFAATRNPRGLNRLIISNSPAINELWIKTAWKLRAQLPHEVQDALQKHESAGTLDSQEYGEAMRAYMLRHICRVYPWPPDVEAAFIAYGNDPTSGLTMNGRHEFEATGTLKDWTIVPDLPKITARTLIISGKHDVAQDDAIRPWFLGIPKCKWVQFSESSHMPQWEERDRFMEVASEFLLGN